MGASWLERVQAGELLLLDGGMGTELRRRGIAMSGSAWSGTAARDHVSELASLHRDYITAGADIITTNTFATTRFVLEAAGCADEFTTINRNAVRVARAARDAAASRFVAVAGSLSCFPPRFDPGAYPSPVVEQAAYHELAQLLADEGVDLIALEMIEDAEHGLRALDAALATHLPVMLGLSVRRRGRGLVAYDYPQRALDAYLGPLLERGPAVVAVMHTPPDVVGDALDALAAAGWHGPTGAYPELGTVAAPGAPRGAVPSPAAFAAMAHRWVDRGVRLLGGCCGARPEHIAALAGLRAELRRVGQP